MNEHEEELEARLSDLTEQLLAEQRFNQQLRLEIDFAYTREKASLEALKETEERLVNALAEKDSLRDENDKLRFHLSESRNKMQQSRIVEEGEVCYAWLLIFIAVLKYFLPYQIMSGQYFIIVFYS